MLHPLSPGGPSYGCLSAGPSGLMVIALSAVYKAGEPTEERPPPGTQLPSMCNPTCRILVS